MANSKMADENLFGNIDDEIKKLGRTNIIIAGRSGVGKTTMINAIFKQEVAKTGVGLQITNTITAYPVVGSTVTLFDTRGIEMKEYQKTVSELREFIRLRQVDTDSNNHIHIGWMCILEGAKRLEDGEIAVVKMLQQYMRVIVVICQSYERDEAFIAKTKEIFQYLEVEVKVMSVIAMEKTFRKNPPIGPEGLEELANSTIELLPAAYKNAFIAAQRISFEAKQIKAQAIVGTAAAAAAVVGATPIPFSDAVALIPIQATMIIGITGVFGFKVDRSIIMALLGIYITGSGATGIGLLFSNLLKFIPGVGTITGGIIDASIASAVTTTFGEIYIAVLIKLFRENNGVQPTTDQLLAKCREEWNKKKQS